MKIFVYIWHMAGIHVYNIMSENHDKGNVFYIGRPSVLGNPYTHIKDRDTLARYLCKTRDEAIDKYSGYFDTMYGSNVEFTKKINEIYDLYQKGEDVYLACFCKPERCHGDIIVEKLQKKLLKEKIKILKNASIIQQKQMA